MSLVTPRTREARNTSILMIALHYCMSCNAVPTLEGFLTSKRLTVVSRTTSTSINETESLVFRIQMIQMPECKCSGLLQIHMIPRFSNYFGTYRSNSYTFCILLREP